VGQAWQVVKLQHCSGCGSSKADQRKCSKNVQGCKQKQQVHPWAGKRLSFRKRKIVKTEMVWS